MYLNVDENEEATTAKWKQNNRFENIPVFSKFLNFEQVVHLKQQHDPIFSLRYQNNFSFPTLHNSTQNLTFSLCLL